MKNSSLPSTKFLIRGSIAIAIIATILIVQTNWFRQLFHKKPIPLPPNATVGDVIDADSNHNGIPDWEERLWGLDPTKTYTNGVPNAEIIAEKQKALGVAGSDTAQLDDTDKLARDLFTLTNGLDQDDVDDATLQAVAAELGKDVNIKTSANIYSISDIKTIKTTYASLTAYRKTLNVVLTKYNTDDPNIELVINALQNGDYSQLPELATAATQYASVANDLSKIPVPVGVAAFHLDIINGFAGMAESFGYLQELNDNGVDALSGLALYKNYSELFSNAVTNLGDYLTRYGIL